MTEIDHNLFSMHRGWTSAGDSKKYNAMIDDIREKARKKFEVPRWDATVKYANRFARFGWNKYPKITPNAWKAHLKIEAELDLALFPALFVCTYPVKDAGAISWGMLDENQRVWGSPAHLRDILKKKHKLFTSDFNNIDFEVRVIE